MVLSEGARLGPYEILAPLGAGGMGEVYRARDTRLGRDVAIKILPQDLATDPSRLRRFEQEARTVASLSHPNVVALYDIGTHGGAPYLVSELLEGGTLGDRLEVGGLPIRDAVATAIQIARGLAAAHAKNIVHRDLKPANIFTTRDGQVKILDFGIAKLTRPERDAEVTETTRALSTETGAVIGTVGYMAPEQVRGLPTDHRTDIFAFGCVLYEMLSGRRAFQGATSADTISAILKEDPPPLRELRETVSPGLQRIVDRCLQKRPEDRFSSAHDLALGLEAISIAPASEESDATRPGTVDERGRQRSPSRGARSRLWLLGALIVLGAVAVAVPVGMRLYRQAWVRNQAIPELLRLVDGREYWPAFLLARRIDEAAPGDATLANLRPRFTGTLRRELKPDGAKVLARPRMGADTDWIELGDVKGTPIPAPLGYSVFRLQAPGFESREFGMAVSEFGWDHLTMRGS